MPSVHWKLFVQPPFPGARPRSVEQLARRVAAAAEAGIDEVLIEVNLWDEIRSSSAWVDVPTRLAPVLRGAP